MQLAKPKAPIYILGAVVSLALTLLGFLWAIPELGFFGIVWTGLVFAIAMYNAYVGFFFTPPKTNGSKADVNK